MPRAYEKMRDQFKSQGMTSSKAKEKAARIYNAKNPTNPVGKHGKKGNSHNAIDY